MSIAMVITVLRYCCESELASPDYSAGLGVFVALVGGLVSAIGEWCGFVLPYGPRRPLRREVVRRRLSLQTPISIAAVSMVSMWQLDGHGGVVLAPALQAEIEEVKRKAEAGEMDVGVAATEIQVIRAKAQRLSAL